MADSWFSFYAVPDVCSKGATPQITSNLFSIFIQSKLISKAKQFIAVTFPTPGTDTINLKSSLNPSISF